MTLETQHFLAVRTPYDYQYFCTQLESLIERFEPLSSAKFRIVGETKAGRIEGEGYNGRPRVKELAASVKLLVDDLLQTLRSSETYWLTLDLFLKVREPRFAWIKMQLIHGRSEALVPNITGPLFKEHYPFYTCDTILGHSAINFFRSPDDELFYPDQLIRTYHEIQRSLGLEETPILDEEGELIRPNPL